ncbi:MAG: hypothetical protein WKF70_14355 [Chitinophagaceae bacterium]
MRADFGPPLLSARMFMGAFIIKHILNIDHREVVQYPTDLNLLNEGREQLERIIAKGCKALDTAQPRMYKQTARKMYLNIAKKKRKMISQIRNGIRQQLQYVNRDLRYVNDLVALSQRKGHPLSW